VTQASPSVPIAVRTDSELFTTLRGVPRIARKLFPAASILLTEEAINAVPGDEWQDLPAVDGRDRAAICGLME